MSVDLTCPWATMRPRRRLYAGRASAALAIRKSARALNLHLKRRRLAQVCTSHTRARRSPPQLAAFFFANPVGGARWSSEQLRGRRCDRRLLRTARMGIGRLLALDSEPAHWCLYPLA